MLVPENRDVGLPLDLGPLGRLAQCGDHPRLCRRSQLKSIERGWRDFDTALVIRAARDDQTSGCHDGKGNGRERDKYSSNHDGSSSIRFQRKVIGKLTARVMVHIPS